MVERHGIAYHEKELGQLFCDVSSKLIVKMLLDECAAAGVRSRDQLQRRARDDRSDDGGSACTPRTGRSAAPALVVASGGLSIPSMGATGFGYELARQFGHAVLPTRAGLVPLTLSGKHQERLARPQRRRVAGRAPAATARASATSCWSPTAASAGRRSCRSPRTGNPATTCAWTCCRAGTRSGCCGSGRPIARRRNCKTVLVGCPAQALRAAPVRGVAAEPADEAVQRAASCATSRSAVVAGRWSPAAPRAIAPPKSRWAAWTPTSCPPRTMQSQPRARPVFHRRSASTSPAGWAATTSSGPGRRGMRRVRPCRAAFHFGPFILVFIFLHAPHATMF